MRHAKQMLAALLAALALTAAAAAALWGLVLRPAGLMGTAASAAAAEAPAATPQPTAAPTATPVPLAENEHLIGNTGDTVTLAFTGDVCFADNWNIMQNCQANYGGDVESCFSPELLETMRSADVLLMNNEFCISDRGTALPGKQYTFRAQSGAAEIWNSLGADLVGLANNHCYDYGPEAFADTLDNLHRAGVPTIGAGKNLAQAMEPQIFIAADGTRIAYIACTRAEKFIMTAEATENEAGVLRCYDPALACQAIRAAKAQADFVVVYVHWGTEGSTVLETAQTDLATAFTEAGADLIVGAHPHCLQGGGWREETPVLYSLGNYWFNMKTCETALLQVTLTDGKLEEVRLLPCLQSNGTTTLYTDADTIAQKYAYLNTIMESGRFDENGIFRQE